MQGRWSIRVNPVSFGASVVLIWTFAVRSPKHMPFCYNQRSSILLRVFTSNRFSCDHLFLIVVSARYAWHDRHALCASSPLYGWIIYTQHRAEVLICTFGFTHRETHPLFTASMRTASWCCMLCCAPRPHPHQAWDMTPGTALIAGACAPH